MFAAEVNRTRVVDTTKGILAAARRASVPVFYTRVVYQPGYPGIIVNGPLYEGIQPAGAFIAGEKGVEIVVSDATAADSATSHENALTALSVLCEVAASSEITDALT